MPRLQHDELLAYREIRGEEVPTRPQEANPVPRDRTMNRNMARSYNKIVAGGRSYVFDFAVGQCLGDQQVITSTTPRPALDRRPARECGVFRLCFWYIFSTAMASGRSRQKQDSCFDILATSVPGLNSPPICFLSSCSARNINALHTMS
jgi:hypothetical protein